MIERSFRWILGAWKGLWDCVNEWAPLSFRLEHVYNKRNSLLENHITTCKIELLKEERSIDLLFLFVLWIFMCVNDNTSIQHIGSVHCLWIVMFCWVFFFFFGKFYRSLALRCSFEFSVLLTVLWLLSECCFKYSFSVLILF